VNIERQIQYLSPLRSALTLITVWDSKYKAFQSGGVQLIMLGCQDRFLKARIMLTTRSQLLSKDLNDTILMERTYTYDGAGHLISVINPPWSSGNGNVYGTVSYTNNSSGLPVTELYEHDPSSFPKVLRTYIYYPSGKISEYVDLILTSTHTLNAARVLRVYDPSGKLFEEGYHGWAGTSWLKNETFTYTYLPSGRIDYVMHLEGFGPGAEAPEKYLYEWFESYPTTEITELHDAEDLLQPAVYFDLLGRKIEKQKNIILVEQRGNVRRKIIIQDSSN
jgi:hypothetical protein